MMVSLYMFLRMRESEEGGVGEREGRRGETGRCDYDYGCDVSYNEKLCDMELEKTKLEKTNLEKK